MLGRRTKFVLAVFVFFSATVAPVAYGANPFDSLWPTKKKASPTIQSPFAPKLKKSDTILGMPTPSSLLDKAERQTDKIFNKTRKGWQDMKNFGKSLNPFPQQQKKQTSWLDRILPKQPVDQGPATMGEFLQMDRPRY